MREFGDDRWLLFATRDGKVKRTPLAAYGNVRKVGIRAINIREGDELIDVRITGGDDEVILATEAGKAIRFRESDCRGMGRVAEGVMGIRLAEGDRVVGMVVVRPDSSLLVVTDGGMGKRTEVGEYRLQRRGGKGVISMKLSERAGKVVSIKAVSPDEELMLITRRGVINRQRTEEISVIGRLTKGVRLVALDEKDEIMDVARIVADNGPGDGAGGAGA